jgi:hypothetical protein
MKITQEFYTDCTKYYADTYVQFKEEGPEKVFLIKMATSEHIFALDMTNGAEPIAVAIKNGYVIDFQLPSKRVFQAENRAVIIERIPARQWKKGIHSQNTQFSCLNKAGGWSKLPFDIYYILKAHKPSEFITFDEWILLPEDANFYSHAMTSRLSITMFGSIYLDTIQVGKYNRKNRVLMCHPIVQKEVCPHFLYAELQEY